MASRFSLSETRGQYKVAMVTGTDSTAMNLAMICFMFAQQVLKV